MKQITFAQAEHQNKKKVTRRERFLAEMNVLVPWQRLLDALSPSYYPDAAGKRGRPPTPLDRMLRIYFLQQWYGLADEALEDAIYDSQAMRDFVGIDLSIESVPDATTLLRFRHQSGRTWFVHARRDHCRCHHHCRCTFYQEQGQAA